MQLGASRPTGPPPRHLAEALSRAASQFGHRPAVTLLLPGSRQEQSYHSLAQWASKGAHFLTLELLLERGDRIRLDAPPSWGAAAVALAAWWAGIAVCLDDADADVAIVHEGRVAPHAEDVLWLGDGFDGAPVSATSGDAWVHAVQSFPDQPPAPDASPDSVAVIHRDTKSTQAELLGSEPVRGVLGIADGADPVEALLDTAVQPLLSGAATVVLRGVEREAARDERVATWR